jgi:hypothetical protein
MKIILTFILFGAYFLKMKSSNVLDNIPNCIIDPKGVFKYIQIFVRSKFTDEKKYVVRGFKKYSFHAENFENFKSKFY